MSSLENLINEAKSAKLEEEVIEVFDDERSKKVEELETRILYLTADIDNVRKRSAENVRASYAKAKADIIKELLPILDDVERAQNNIANDGLTSTNIEGISLIFNKLTDTLSKQGLRVMSTKEEKFDVNKHEAVSSISLEGKEKNDIIDCVQNGYTLDDKVIRYAKVIVAV